MSILNPGIHLLGKMKMPQKMLLIAVIFLIPVVYLLVVYERNLNAQIEFSQLELEGVRQITPLRAMIQTMQLHRGVSQLALAGNAEAKAKLGGFRDKINTAIAEQDKVDEALGSKLGTGDAWRKRIECDALVLAPPARALGRPTASTSARLPLPGRPRGFLPWNDPSCSAPARSSGSANGTARARHA